MKLSSRHCSIINYPQRINMMNTTLMMVAMMMIMMMHSMFSSQTAQISLRQLYWRKEVLKWHFADFVSNILMCVIQWISAKVYIFKEENREMFHAFMILLVFNILSLFLTLIYSKIVLFSKLEILYADIFCCKM